MIQYIYIITQSSDFHADLFPDTLGGTPAMTAEQWLQGANLQVTCTMANHHAA